MSESKIIQQQIDEIIERQYNGYRGAEYKLIGALHKDMRSKIGDYIFLAYLEKQERDNPKPEYKIPNYAKEEEPGNK